MTPEILTYNNNQSAADKAICELLANEICKYLHTAENKYGMLIPFGF